CCCRRCATAGSRPGVLAAAATCVCQAARTRVSSGGSCCICSSFPCPYFLWSTGARLPLWFGEAVLPHPCAHSMAISPRRQHGWRTPHRDDARQIAGACHNLLSLLIPPLDQRLRYSL